MAPMKNKQAPKRKTSEYRGVRKRGSRYAAEIRNPYKIRRLWLGAFDTEVQAAMAYDDAARRFHGAEAIVNFPDVDVVSVQNSMRNLRLNDVPVPLGIDLNMPPPPED